MKNPIKGFKSPGKWRIKGVLRLFFCFLALGCGGAIRTGTDCPIGSICGGEEGPARSVSYLRTLGNDGRWFRNGFGLAVSPDGLTVGVDADLGQIFVFDAAGGALRSFGKKGSGLGALLGPFGVASADDGTLFVADTFNHRVTRFSMKGDYVYSWGSEGGEDGLFQNPADAAASGEWIYIADATNGRVQKFTRDGAFERAWKGTDSVSGPFLLPIGIGVDGAGDVYVADRGGGSGRIVKFDGLGRFLKEFKGLFNQPRDVAVDAEGNVYVTDDQADKVFVLDSGGNLFEEWEGGDDGFRPRGIAIAPSGEAAVFNNPSPGYCCSRIEFYSHGLLTRSVGKRPSDPDQLESPASTAVLEDGTVLVLDWIKNGVLVYGPDGSHLEFLRAGEGGAFENVPQDIVSLGGRFAALDGAVGAILTFEPDGTPVQRIDGPAGDNPLIWAQHLSRTRDGGWLVVNPIGQKVCEFDGSGFLRRCWGGSGKGPGQFDSPSAAAQGPSGRVYVADTENHRVQRFDSEGRFEAEWGEKGIGKGQFDAPADILTDSKERVFVLDRDNHRVQVFNGDGEFLDQFGGPSSGHTGFDEPRRMAFGLENEFLLADWGNKRVEVYRYILNVEP